MAPNQNVNRCDATAQPSDRLSLLDMLFIHTLGIVLLTVHSLLVAPVIDPTNFDALQYQAEATWYIDFTVAFLWLLLFPFGYWLIQKTAGYHRLALLMVLYGAFIWYEAIPRQLDPSEIFLQSANDIFSAFFLNYVLPATLYCGVWLIFTAKPSHPWNNHIRKTIAKKQRTLVVAFLSLFLIGVRVPETVEISTESADSYSIAIPRDFFRDPQLTGRINLFPPFWERTTQAISPNTRRPLFSDETAIGSIQLQPKDRQPIEMVQLRGIDLSEFRSSIELGSLDVYFSVLASEKDIALDASPIQFYYQINKSNLYPVAQDTQRSFQTPIVTCRDIKTNVYRHDPEPISEFTKAPSLGFGLGVTRYVRNNATNVGIWNRDRLGPLASTYALWQPPTQILPGSESKAINDTMNATYFKEVRGRGDTSLGDSVGRILYSTITNDRTILSIRSKEIYVEIPASCARIFLLNIFGARKIETSGEISFDGRGKSTIPSELDIPWSSKDKKLIMKIEQKSDVSDFLIDRNAGVQLLTFSQYDTSADTKVSMFYSRKLKGSATVHGETKTINEGQSVLLHNAILRPGGNIVARSSNVLINQELKSRRLLQYLSSEYWQVLIAGIGLYISITVYRRDKSRLSSEISSPNIQKGNQRFAKRIKQRIFIH
jgi:hypothetical protein